MLSLNNIKIGYRILMVSVFAAVMTATVAGVSIYNLRSVGQRLTLVAEQDQLVSSRTLELRVAAEQEKAGIRGYLLSGDLSFLEPFMSGQSHYSVAAIHLEELVQSEEDKELLFNINALHSRFLETAEEAILLYGRGFRQEAVLLWQEQGYEIEASLITMIVEFTNRQQQTIRQHAQEAEDQQSQARVMTLVLVGIALIVGIGGPLWITRSITKPIKSLVSSTEAVTRGDLTTSISIPGTDELASLGNAMNWMIQTLALSRETTDHLSDELRELLDYVENRVADRTRELVKLEELGRAIVMAPSITSTLSDLLREHVPNMFPDSQISICIFPNWIVLHHPDDWPPVAASTWEWLRTTTEVHCFVPDEVLPWTEQPATSTSVVAPILDEVSKEPIGGISLVPSCDPDVAANLVPAIQTLAAQIASALYRVNVDAEMLAHQRVSQELALAGRIQASFLPDTIPKIPGWQLAATLVPAKETGGDFYDVIPLQDGKLGILIADVTDKGMGAALYMALSRTLIRTYAIEYPKQPELVFSATNNRIMADTHTGLFVTVFYGILDPSTGTLIYCSAGHNPPYIFDAQNGKVVQALHKTGVPLGLFDGVSWKKGNAQLAPGNVLLLYTDGVTEAENAEEAFFDSEQLLEVVQDNLGHSAQFIQDAIIAKVHEFVGDAPQSDDITLMTIVRELPQKQIDL